MEDSGMMHAVIIGCIVGTITTPLLGFCVGGLWWLFS